MRGSGAKPGRNSAKRDSAKRGADALFGVALILALWKAAAVGVGLEIILPPPERVLAELAAIAVGKEFAAALAATALRGAASFAISMALGAALGVAMGSSTRAKALAAPAMTVARATPVIAVILIAQAWFSDGAVPVFSAVIMAFPVVAADVAAGVAAADPRLLEMAACFSVPRRGSLWGIRIPSALPHVLSAARNALGLSWKVIVAGEVLSQPRFAVGARLQVERNSLETARVFAWAAVGILLCALSDALFDAASRRLPWRAR